MSESKHTAGGISFSDTDLFQSWLRSKNIDRKWFKQQSLEDQDLLVRQSFQEAMKKDTLEAINKELLEALEALVQILPSCCCRECGKKYANALKAIAKARGAHD